MELQSKRRRVTRACDECRKKKVKCDGKQPCIHCTVYNYDCTYNQPTRRAIPGSGPVPAGNDANRKTAGTDNGGSDAGGDASGPSHSKRAGGNDHYSSSSYGGTVPQNHSHQKKYSTSKNKQLQNKVSKYHELLKEI